MSDSHKSHLWKEKANSEYQKVINACINLATASLVLPAIFLKDFVTLPKGTSVFDQLTISVFVSWIALTLSIIFGVSFYYTSAKWLKQSYGGTVSCSENCLEKILNWFFWLTPFTLLVGIFSLIWFISFYVPES